jgi:hypothetical protein
MTERLEALIGEWEVGAVFPEGKGTPNTDEKGAVSFEWLCERKFSEDGNRIEAFWDRTDDGAWVRDFDLIYTRAE